MGLTVAANGGGDFKSVEPGSYAARCVRIVDIGTQHGEYQGKPNAKKEVIVSFELPNELMDDGRPFMLSKFYTASLGEKANLRKDLEAWRGVAFSEADLAGFDLDNILGKACMLSVIEKNGKARVGAISKLPKGMELPPAVNPLVSFSIADWDEAKFNELSDFTKEKIRASDEYKARSGEVITADGAPW
jgi:hypothetical protein